MNYDNYYRNMETGEVLREYQELVAEWRRDGKDVDRRVCGALSAIWREMKRRGNPVPGQLHYDPTERLPSW